MDVLTTLYGAVRLNYKNIGDQGVDKIFVEECSKIVQLHLVGNQIKDVGFIKFSSANWMSLTVLNLNKNRIGKKECKYISMATINNLRQIGLSYNQIGNEGLLHLSKGQWRKLQKLYIWENKVSGQGVKYLTHAGFPKIMRIAYQQIIIEDLLHFIFLRQSLKQLLIFNLAERANGQISRKDKEKLIKLFSKKGIELC